MLPYTDRATHHVSRNLVMLFSRQRVETSCTVNPQQIEVTEFERHGRRPTCSKLRVFQPRRIDRRRCGKQARPSTSFIDNAIDLPWQNLPSSAFGTYPYYWRYPNFLITQCRIGRRKLTDRFVLMQYRCVTDRQTDGRQVGHTSRRQHMNTFIRPPTRQIDRQRDRNTQ